MHAEVTARRPTGVRVPADDLREVPSGASPPPKPPASASASTSASASASASGAGPNSSAAAAAAAPSSTQTQTLAVPIMASRKASYGGAENFNPEQFMSDDEDADAAACSATSETTRARDASSSFASSSSSPNLSTSESAVGPVHVHTRSHASSSSSSNDLLEEKVSSEISIVGELNANLNDSHSSDTAHLSSSSEPRDVEVEVRAPRQRSASMPLPTITRSRSSSLSSDMSQVSEASEASESSEASEVSEVSSVESEVRLDLGALLREPVKQELLSPRPEMDGPMSLSSSPAAGGSPSTLRLSDVTALNTESASDPPEPVKLVVVRSSNSQSREAPPPKLTPALAKTLPAPSTRGTLSAKPSPLPAMRSSMSMPSMVHNVTFSPASSSLMPPHVRSISPLSVSPAVLSSRYRRASVSSAASSLNGNLIVDSEFLDLEADYLDQVNTALDLIARMKNEMFTIETSHAARERVRKSIQMDHAHLFRHSSSASLFGLPNLWETASQASASSSHSHSQSSAAESDRDRNRDQEVPLFSVNGRSRWAHRSHSLSLSRSAARSRSSSSLKHSTSLPNIPKLRSMNFENDFETLRNFPPSNKRRSLSETRNEAKSDDLNVSKLAKRLSPDFDFKDAVVDPSNTVENTTPELTRVVTPEETLAHAAFTVSDPCATSPSSSPSRPTSGSAAARTRGPPFTPEGHRPRASNVPPDDFELKVEEGASEERPDALPPAPHSRSRARQGRASASASSSSMFSPTPMAQLPSPISALDSYMSQSPGRMDISALSAIGSSARDDIHRRDDVLSRSVGPTRRANMLDSPTSAPPARKRRRPASSSSSHDVFEEESKRPPVSRMLSFGAAQSPPLKSSSSNEAAWPAPPMLSPALSAPKGDRSALAASVTSPSLSAQLDSIAESVNAPPPRLSLADHHSSSSQTSTLRSDLSARRRGSSSAESAATTTDPTDIIINELLSQLHATSSSASTSSKHTVEDLKAAIGLMKVNHDRVVHDRTELVEEISAFRTELLEQKLQVLQLQMKLVHEQRVNKLKSMIAEGGREESDDKRASRRRHQRYSSFDFGSTRNRSSRRSDRDRDGDRDRDRDRSHSRRSRRRSLQVRSRSGRDASPSQVPAILRSSPLPHRSASSRRDSVSSASSSHRARVPDTIFERDADGDEDEGGDRVARSMPSPRRRRSLRRRDSRDMDRDVSPTASVASAPPRRRNRVRSQSPAHPNPVSSQVAPAAAAPSSSAFNARHPQQPAVAHSEQQPQQLRVSADSNSGGTSVNINLTRGSDAYGGTSGATPSSVTFQVTETRRPDSTEAATRRDSDMVSFQIRRSYLIAGLCGAGLLIAWGMRALAASRRRSHEVDSCLSELRAEVRSMQKAAGVGGAGVGAGGNNGGSGRGANGYRGVGPASSASSFRGANANSFHNPESSASPTTSRLPATGVASTSSSFGRAEGYLAHHHPPPSSSSSSLHWDASNARASSTMVSSVTTTSTTTTTQTCTASSSGSGGGAPPSAHQRRQQHLSYEAIAEIVNNLLAPIANILY